MVSENVAGEAGVPVLPTGINLNHEISLKEILEIPVYYLTTTPRPPPDRRETLSRTRSPGAGHAGVERSSHGCERSDTFPLRGRLLLLN